VENILLATSKTQRRYRRLHIQRLRGRRAKQRASSSVVVLFGASGGRMQRWHIVYASVVHSNPDAAHPDSIFTHAYPSIIFTAHPSGSSNQHSIHPTRFEHSPSRLL